MSTERIRYAVQYPPREVGKEPLWLNLNGESRFSADLLDATLWDFDCQCGGAASLWTEGRDYRMGRVVRVREIVTREVVD